jgi:hypothetical protein
LFCVQEQETLIQYKTSAKKGVQIEDIESGDPPNSKQTANKGRNLHP